MAPNEEYSRADVRRQFGLSERQLRSWEREDLLSPADTYSFSDLIAIQTLIQRTLSAKGVLDKSLRSALAAMNLPSTEDVESLRRKIADLDATLSRIESKLEKVPEQPR